MSFLLIYVPPATMTYHSKDYDRCLYELTAEKNEAPLSFHTYTRI